MTESNDIAYRTRKFINSYYNEASLVLEAINETVDQEILIELTNPRYYRDYRVKAIKYIDEDSEENQELFNRLANEDLDKRVRTAALAKINANSTDNQLLFIDLAKSGHLEAIKKIKSEYVLAEIAFNTSSDKIFQEAVININDEQILTDIGYKFPESETCDYIVDRISNQEVLTKIVCHNPFFKICYKAFQKITNSSSFQQIAFESEFYQFRAASIEKINDKNILEYIFMNDENDYVRLCALEKCKSVELLLTIILGNDYYNDSVIHKYALNNIDDESILKQLFEESSHQNKIHIIPKIKDKSFIAEIAYNYENEYIREIALNSLMENFDEPQNSEKENLDIKTEMYIRILEKKLHQLEDFPESYLSFSRIENNCVYVNVTAYIDPIHFKYSNTYDESWDYFRANDLATKYQPFDFNYDICLIFKYHSY